jgi:hypothetical protein
MPRHPLLTHMLVVPLVQPKLTPGVQSCSLACDSSLTSHTFGA